MHVLDTSTPKGRFLGGGAALVALLLIGTSAYALFGLGRERRHAQELSASNQALNDSLRQLRSELQSMSDRLNSLSIEASVEAPAAAAAPAPRVAAQPKPRATVARTAVRGSVADPRWQQMQTRLTDQQKEIADTREELDRARQDLEGKVNSARDDLSGSIARNHDELSALQKRGQRNYYEFQLDKSKQFQKVGPLSLSVRKVNFKRKYYDLVMMVDDRQLEKKHINLYEPVLLTLTDRPQPIEMVVNEINGSQIKGYVSEPKFKSSELSSTASPAGATKDEELQRR
jgi:hypothetical protein